MSTTGSQVELVVSAVLGGVLCLYMAFIVGTMLREQRVRRKVIVNLPSCGRCGYAIFDTGALACPECGGSLRDGGLRKQKSRSSRKRLWQTRLGIWSVLAVGLAWPVDQALSYVAPGLTTGWWETSFHLTPHITNYKQRPLAGSVEVRLMCAANGHELEAVLPHRVLAVINRPGKMDRAILIDAREGLLWKSDLDWRMSGKPKTLTASAISDVVCEVVNCSESTSAFPSETVKQQGQFFYNLICGLRPIQLNSSSNRSPWPHAVLLDKPVIASGQGQNVAQRPPKWRETAVWISTFCLWLVGCKALWLMARI